MLFTPYLTKHRHSGIADQLLLFSTKTGALILLPEEDFIAISNGATDSDYIEPLREMGFLIDDIQAEHQEVYRYMEDINRYSPNLTLAIVLGMSCNFGCRYCFEGQQKSSNKAMDEQTIDQLISFVKERFSPNKKKLILQVYGGEPLLYTKELIRLAKELKPFVEGQGAEFLFDLVSNGSLLTEAVVVAIWRTESKSNN